MTGNRVLVMHGVNLDQLGRRPPEHYPQMTLAELEVAVGRCAPELGLAISFDQTNHEGEFCETLHEAAETADGLLLNPGAWTHYAYAIRDAVEFVIQQGLKVVEVHLSDIDGREEFRRHSVLEGIVSHRIKGQGPDGYRHAIEWLTATAPAATTVG